jgi:hypothetical protein
MYAELLLSPPGGTQPIDVIIYAGNLDPLLGAPMAAAGVRATFDFAELHLSGGAEAKNTFYSSPKSIWWVGEGDTQPAGYARCLDRPPSSGDVRPSRFCYVVVRNAGHEAASYSPRAAYDLSDRFIRRAPFGERRGADDPAMPQCAPCGGAPPLAGGALPACNLS